VISSVIEARIKVFEAHRDYYNVNKQFVDGINDWMGQCRRLGALHA
jgi:hypothetical protein